MTSVPQKRKDPQRQLLGKIAREKGKQFEARLDESLSYYAAKGFAVIEKTPEPMRIIKSLGEGRFIACFTGKAQADYKGTIKGGRAVLFEAKFTASGKLEQNRVRDDQADYLDRQHALGARCFVVAGFQSGNVYRIPWDVWTNMKSIFGRKYVTEPDLEQYLVPIAWHGGLMLLD